MRGVSLRDHQDPRTSWPAPLEGQQWLCAVAGLPLPNVIVSDTDLSAGPPIPGLHVTCQPVSVTNALRVARSVVNILKYVDELVP